MKRKTIIANVIKRIKIKTTMLKLVSNTIILKDVEDALYFILKSAKIICNSSEQNKAQNHNKCSSIYTKIYTRALINEMN